MQPAAGASSWASGRATAGTDLNERVPTRRDLRVFAGYCLAAAVYVAIGVTVTDFLLSFWVGVAYVLVAAWLVPLAVRKLL